MKKISIASLLIISTLIISLTPAYATIDNNTLRFYSKNNILYYDPSGYSEYSNTSSGCGATISKGGSFRVNPNENPWYAEGDYIRTYGGGYGTVYLKKEDGIPIYEDENMGGMQYIYAERYDADWSSWPPKLKKNSNNTSTKKYYLIVLPQDVYGSASFETFVATFQKLSDPVYFIVLDVHATNDQKYTGTEITKQAKGNPKFAAGDNLLGVLSKYNGNPSKVYAITGGITSFHRLTGNSDQILHEVPVGEEESIIDPCAGEDTEGVASSDIINQWPNYFYSQCDPRWSSYKADGSHTMCSTGCGPTSFASIAKAYGLNVSPTDAMNFAVENGNILSSGYSNAAISEDLASHYGLAYETIFGYTSNSKPNSTELINKINQKLREGWLIHTVGNEPGTTSGDGDTPYSNGGHFVTIRNISGDSWLVSNPGRSDISYSEKKFKQTTMIQYMRQAVAIKGR